VGRDPGGRVGRRRPSITFGPYARGAGHYTIERSIALPRVAADDEVVALQLTAMAWTIAKLMTLHRARSGRSC